MRQRAVKFSSSSNMKATLILFLSLAVAALAGPLLDNEQDQNVYFLFTRSNPTEAQTLIINDVESVSNSNFNPALPTMVIADGWLVREKLTDFVTVVKDAFLETSDVNVIILDWSSISMSDYLSASAGAPGAGRNLGLFLSFLNEQFGVSFGSMFLVGFDLGGHLVGNAGRAVGGQISRITALDPNSLLWVMNPDRLTSTDASYVEVIHTDSGPHGLGIGSAIGGVNFYPNGGVVQPGCASSDCRHNRAWELFASTIGRNHLIGNKCADIMEMALDLCQGDYLPMGTDDLVRAGSGIYRVNTGMDYPYYILF